VEGNHHRHRKPSQAVERRLVAQPGRRLGALGHRHSVVGDLRDIDWRPQPTS
jgi:hypothetical protein